MGNKKFGAHLQLLCILVLTHLYEIDGSLTRQKYGGRLLNMTPTTCKSARFPNLTGTCMISLECQQRSGTVIGACRDGVLFGACCHDPAEVPTLSPTSVESATDAPAELIGNIHLYDDNENDNRRNEIEELTTVKVETIKEDIPNDNLLSTVPNEIHEHSSSTSEPTTEASSTTSSTPASTTTGQAHKADIITGTPTTVSTVVPSTTSERISETAASESHKVETVRTISIASTTTVSTTPIPSTTKSTPSRIKFSPKPFKPRVTTVKTVWTRPPTTEVSYVVFKKESEEDEDEGEVYSRSSPPSTATESVINALGSGSVEKTTTPQGSVEQTTTVPSTQVTTTTTSTTTTALPVQNNTELETIVVPIPTDPVPSNVTSSISASSANETADEARSSSLMKKSRISSDNDLDSEDDSSSSSLDHKLDDFVNQVVKGIAEELDKSNIDEVVFKSTTTTTTEPSTTRTTSTTPKSKKSVSKKGKGKRKGSSKGKGSSSKSSSSSKGNESKKESIKRASTSTKYKSEVKHAKSKKKPTKKVVTSKVSESNETSIILDHKKDCGVRPLFRQSRIVGGNPSLHGSWPWHALVKETVWWGLFSKIKCGGVLIGSRHVLTAAHCQPQPTGKLSVVLGVTDSDNPSANAVTKAVRRIIKHPQFNGRSYENDIAILELESPVEFHPHIVPICLPEHSETFEGKKGYVTGMGLLKHDGERPLVLHEVDVPIVNNSECQSMFRRSGNSKPIKSSFICAGYPQGLKDSCGGDSGSYRISEEVESNESNDYNVLNETDFFSFSGGPLSVQRNNGQWVLAGTVSHGIKCAVPNQPGVYMRTTWFQPWIEKVTRAARGRAAPKCPGPPGSCDHRGRSRGLLDTLFRVFRLARKMWQSRK